MKRELPKFWPLCNKVTPDTPERILSGAVSSGRKTLFSFSVYISPYIDISASLRTLIKFLPLIRSQQFLIDINHILFLQFFPASYAFNAHSEAVIPILMAPWCPEPQGFGAALLNSAIRSVIFPVVGVQ